MMNKHEKPLVVDLDGTLIKTDLLLESFYAMIHRDPLLAVHVPLWLLKGKAYLKKVENVALRYAMDCSKENVKIVAAKLGNKAGYMGALGFAFDQTTPLL